MDGGWEEEVGEEKEEGRESESPWYYFCCPKRTQSQRMRLRQDTTIALLTPIMGLLRFLPDLS